ncbi:MAG: hypothetical protein ACTHMB_05720, partial [Candidatus Binatia bacterium]
ISSAATSARKSGRNGGRNWDSNDLTVDADDSIEYEMTGIERKNTFSTKGAVKAFKSLVGKSLAL